jgi:hypothetical protein
VLYVLFEWVAHWRSHFWTYFFLELSSSTPLWYAALAVVGVVGHQLVCAASRQKQLRLARAQSSSLTEPLTAPTADADASLPAGDGAEEAGGGLPAAGEEAEEAEVDGSDDADAYRAI